MDGGGTPQVGDPFPSFSLPDLEGRDWTRDDLLGKRTVLFGFSSW